MIRWVSKGARFIGSRETRGVPAGRWPVPPTSSAGDATRLSLSKSGVAPTARNTPKLSSGYLAIWQVPGPISPLRSGPAANPVQACLTAADLYRLFRLSNDFDETAKDLRGGVGACGRGRRLRPVRPRPGRFRQPGGARVVPVAPPATPAGAG